MHVAVAGASGGTGRHVVQQALNVGHQVTALVRDAARFSGPREVDVHEVDVVADEKIALPEGVDVVVSTLGKRSFRDDLPVCRDGVAHLLEAMRRRGVTRIAVVSASPVLRSSRAEPWWFRLTVLPYVRWSGRRVYTDLEQMESVLRSADEWCEWTIVRPGFLTEADEIGDFLTAVDANVHGSTRRPDLAAVLLDAVGNPAAIRKVYGVASR